MRQPEFGYVNGSSCTVLKEYMHTIVELDLVCKELFKHVMRHRLRSDVLKNNPHRRVITKAAILLIKSKMRRM